MSNKNGRSLRKKHFKHKKPGNPFKKKIDLRSSKKESNFTPKIQTLAQNLAMEFSVPRNPNLKKEFSFEKTNSKEMIIADNFSFSEKLHNNLKGRKSQENDNSATNIVQSSSQKSSPGVFGSICSSIMNRYNSFIQVTPLTSNITFLNRVYYFSKMQFKNQIFKNKLKII